MFSWQTEFSAGMPLSLKISMNVESVLRVTAWGENHSIVFFVIPNLL